MSTRYKVERCDWGTWDDAEWTTDDGKKAEPRRFATEAEANAAIDEMIADVKDAVARGHMDSEYDREDYRVVEDTETTDDTPYNNLALNAAANAACIAREMMLIEADSLRNVSDFDPIREAAVALAEIEDNGGFSWELSDHDWESVCSAIATFLIEHERKPNAAEMDAIMQKDSTS